MADNRYDAVIIGAGIGGLTCGCYLAGAGLKALIIEQGPRPGGYCSSFTRGGYKFDIGVHYFGGVKTGLLGKILKELKLGSRLKLTQFDPSDKILLPGRAVYIRAFYRDTVREFKRGFPEERRNIEKFFNFISQDDFLSLFAKIKKMTYKELLGSFFSCREIKTSLYLPLSNIGVSPAGINAATAAMLFREFILDPGYYPQDSIQDLPDALGERFKSCGGKILLNRRVTKIITRDGRAIGVACGKEKFSAATVISNADARQTFDKLLDIKTAKENLRFRSLKPSPSAFALYLGLKTGIKNAIAETCNIWYFSGYDFEGFQADLKKALTAEELPGMMVSFPSAHRKTEEARVKGCLACLVNAPYETRQFWDRERGTLAQKMLSVLKKFIPNIEDYLDIQLTATPLTFERYTSNYQGATYGWQPTLSQSRSSLLPQETSISGLFLAGHWCTKAIGSGCVSGVASLGRNAAKLILNMRGHGWKYPLLFRKSSVKRKAKSAK